MLAKHKGLQRQMLGSSVCVCVLVFMCVCGLPVAGGKFISPRWPKLAVTEDFGAI